MRCVGEGPYRRRSTRPRVREKEDFPLGRGFTRPRVREANVPRGRGSARPRVRQAAGPRVRRFQNLMEIVNGWYFFRYTIFNLLSRLFHLPFLCFIVLSIMLCLYALINGSDVSSHCEDKVVRKRERTGKKKKKRKKKKGKRERKNWNKNKGKKEWGKKGRRGKGNREKKCFGNRGS